LVLIVLFWMVHLPERIAHQRNHPQFEAIRTLCLLSLLFGGMLCRLPGSGLLEAGDAKLAYARTRSEHGGEPE
jgi:hypothetical protein